MFLRSGDVVLMAGEARECFHGKLKSSNYVVFCMFADNYYLVVGISFCGSLVQPRSLSA